MIDFDTITGRLTISGTVMHGPAWHVVDLTELLTGPELRGTDRLLPGVAGVVANRRRPTVTKVALPMVVAGDCNQAGEPYTDVAGPDDWRGLRRNIAALRAAVVNPPAGITRTAVVTFPEGGSISGQIHVERLQPGKRLGGIMLAVLDITIPAGALS